MVIMRLRTIIWNVIENITLSGLAHCALLCSLVVHPQIVVWARGVVILVRPSIH